MGVHSLRAVPHPSELCLVNLQTKLTRLRAGLTRRGLGEEAKIIALHLDGVLSVQVLPGVQRVAEPQVGFEVAVPGARFDGELLERECEQSGAGYVGRRGRGRIC